MSRFQRNGTCSTAAVRTGKGLPCRRAAAQAWTRTDRRDNNATIHSPHVAGGRPQQARRKPEILMRIDAYTHFFPKRFFDKMTEIAGDYKDMGKRVRSLPALYDLDV